MSNIIPPLLSSTPPPIGRIEDEDDEFGDFATAVDHSYGCDVSIPNTPLDTPTKAPVNTEKLLDKDFQDKRKVVDDEPKNDDMPKLSSGEDDVPSDAIGIPNGVADVERNTPVPEADPGLFEEEHVPSHLNRVDDDVYREEPPEIVPDDDDDADDDFADFEEQNEDDDDFNFKPCDTDFKSNIVDSCRDEITISDTVLNDVTIEQNFEQVLPSNDDVKSISSEFGDFADFDNAANDANTSIDDGFNVDKTDDECGFKHTNIDDFSDFKDSKFTEDFNDSRHAYAGDFKTNFREFKDGDNFGDFKNSDRTSIDNFDDFKDAESIDDFGDFTDSKRTSVDDIGDASTKDDDFGDFASTSAPETSLTLNSKDVLEKAQSIILEMFILAEIGGEDCVVCDCTVGDFVFKEIKDVTDTNALSYQWSKSTSQKGLLKSLNIDTRNILYGPGRRSSMPKFAANLGPAPLEPVKSEILMPTPAAAVPSIIPSTTSQLNQPATTPSPAGDIPTAQFDWNESGLANPLDSAQASTILLDLEQLVASLELTTSSPPPTQTSDLALDGWDIWLQSVARDEEENSQKIKSEEIATIATPSEENAPVTLQEIKSRQFDNESVNSLQFAEEVEESIKSTVQDEFEDFASYQTANKKPEDFSGWSSNMVPLRESYISNVDVKKSDGEEPGWLKPTILTPVLPRKEVEDDDDFAEFQTSQTPNNSGLTVLPIEIKEDDFNDFTSFQQRPVESILQPVQQPIENILQPVSVFKHTKLEPAQIIWPDPGITDDEMMRFEMYSKKTENDVKPSTDVLPVNKIVLPSKEVRLPSNDKVVISKNLVLPILESSPRKYIPVKSKQSVDDDDWSDFVSNQNPVKVLPKLNTFERTSTPELPLSIPQLSHLQPPKLPIPVITPQGLMQTKIPSAMPQPVVQPKVIPLHVNPPVDGYQPSIISNQFAMQINQNTFSGLLQNSNYQTTSIPANMKTPQKSNTNGLQPDDEWSDFVSSRPATNGFSSNDWNRSGPQFNNWNAPVQNPNRNRPTAKKNNIPSISAMPDLDFAAPKNRNFSKK